MGEMYKLSIRWNDLTIKAFKEASDYTNFHKNLSQHIKPLLVNCKTLCDIGCGLGLVDMYLKEYVDKITCIDIDENVIKYLEKEIKQKSIENIECYLKDYKTIEEVFDVILISFFDYEEIDFFSKHCKKLIVIVNDRVSSHIPLSLQKEERLKKHSSSNFESLLKESNFNYKFEKYDLEFGQTFKSKKEIEDYAKSYDEGNQYEEIYNHIITNIKNNEKVVYYLPYRKNFSIFNIDF